MENDTIYTSTSYAAIEKDVITVADILATGGNEKKEKYKAIRLSDAEWELFHRAAKQHERTLCDFMRLAAKMYLLYRCEQNKTTTA